MSVWKQLALSLVVLLVAAAAWVKFFPGSHEILASWGIDWANASTGQPDGKSGHQQSDGGRGKGGGQGAGQGGGGNGPVTIVAEPATSATINDRLQAIGTGRANATVTVTPYTSGRLIAFLVQSGAHIQAGQVIAKLDSETEEIALERTKIARDDAAAKVQRMQALKKSSA